MLLKIPKKKAPSNETKTLGKKPNNGLGDKKLKPISPAGLELFIDKISIIINPASNQDAYDIHSTIWANLNDTAVFQSAGNKARKGWNVARFISVKSTTHRVLFQYRYSKKNAAEPGKAQKIRLEFNPRKLGQQGLLELDAVLTSLWDAGWGYVIKQGVMTRIDVAVDIPNLRMDEFLFIPKQGATEIQWGRDGHLQSFRHGQPKGNQTVVYDVKHKRLSKKPLWSGPSKIRVERRLRAPSPAKLQDIGLLKNPFAEMVLAVMPGPPPDELEKKKDWMWSMFQDSVKVRGVREALALLPVDRRTKYRRYLKQFSLPFWNPKEIWKAWPTAYEPLLKGFEEPGGYIVHES